MFLITERHAILLGKNFTVDGHERRLFRVVTHFHSDHVIDIEKSLRECSSIIGTPITLDSMNVLGYTVPKHKRLDLEYSTQVELLGEKIVLEKADHIMGASQVIVKSDDLTLAYTGDFKNPGKTTPIINSDVLVIDVTYGSPNHIRPYKNEAEMLFTDYIADALIKGPVVIYAYYGKLQEVMKILRGNGVIAPFIVDGKVEELTKIAIKYGEKITDVFSKNSKEGKEIIKDSWYVEFKHASSFKNRDKLHFNFLLDGWTIKEFIKRIDEKSYILGISSHADFEDIIYYVENSTADIIVPDASRSKYAFEFAEYMKKIDSKKKVMVMPSPTVSDKP
ncbi:MBL fold metallo-hydrolase [Sulfolobaceae archaeon RB850M]